MASANWRRKSLAAMIVGTVRSRVSHASGRPSHGPGASCRCRSGRTARGRSGACRAAARRRPGVGRRRSRPADSRGPPQTKAASPRRRACAHDPREAKDLPGKGISKIWSITSAPSANCRPEMLGESSESGCESGLRSTGTRLHGTLSRAGKAACLATRNSTRFGPRTGAMLSEFQGRFCHRNSLQTARIRRAASVTSVAVVVAPKLNRNALPATASSQPIANSAGDGSLEPLAQAEPVEQATPAWSKRHEQRLTIEAHEGEARGVRQPRRVAAQHNGLGPTLAEGQLELVAELVQAGRPSVAVGVPQFQCPQHADHERDRFSPRSQAGLLEAAEQLRRKLHVVSDHQRADAERAVELVCGDGHRRGAQPRKSTGRLPTTCAASVCSGTPCWWQMAANSATGWSTPVSFWPRIAHMSRVSGRSNSGKRPTRITPRASTPSWSTCQPTRAKLIGQAVDAGMLDGGDDEVGCVAWPAQASFARIQQAADGEVVGLGAAAGEDHAVGVAARGAAPSSWPIRSRASSSTRRACRPNECWLAGFKSGAS